MRELKEYPRYREICDLLLDLWGQAVGKPLYQRRRWEELQSMIEGLARKGLGLPDGYNDDKTPVERRVAIFEGSVDNTTWVEICRSPIHVPVSSRDLNLSRFLWFRTVVKES